jgi:hypothetical protein
MTTELTTTHAAELAHRADHANIYADELGIGSQIVSVTFDRVKVPSGGALSWELPSGNPDEPEVSKELVGVVVDDHFMSTLWLDDFAGDNTPPDATWFEVSPNQVVAQINERARTAGAKTDLNEDPFNAWGSGTGGRGKKAKQMYRLYVLRDGDILPIMLTVPPSSIKAWTDFKRYILGKQKLVPQVSIRMGLKKVQKDGVPAFSQITFSIDRELAEDESAEMLAKRAEFRVITRRPPGMRDDKQGPIAPPIGDDDVIL